MRIISAVFFTILLNIAPACAEWVNVQDIKEPIKLLDTDNIYKLNYQGADGAVFRLRYIGKDKKEQVASIFADFKNNKAGIISIKPYRENTIPNFAIVDELKMKDITENEMSLEFLSKSNNEAFARVTVAAFVASLDPTIEELADIKTAVSEAVTNCIIHGYEGKEGTIKIVRKDNRKKINN